MKLINDDTLEFEEISSDSESILVSRKSYRLPIGDRATHLLEANGKTYPLMDISMEGVCIAIEAASPISSEDIKPSCKLILGEQSFDGLEGEVVHASLDGDGNWICGIQWLKIDEQTLKSLEQMLIRLRKEIFNNA
ncbi:PilZ domain-containing protein [uncultured Amphritea sp.]|uniref:PilZ domain-containing protein n=1 Tax=uncultured Amphritea sp. TaxID=981605 RepID=UPI002616A619|nr:PilZ domain-containing protein [uncultured Amphritea sp.]